MEKRAKKQLLQVNLGMLRDRCPAGYPLRYTGSCKAAVVHLLDGSASGSFQDKVELLRIRVREVFSVDTFLGQQGRNMEDYRAVLQFAKKLPCLCRNGHEGIQEIMHISLPTLLQQGAKIWAFFLGYKLGQKATGPTGCQGWRGQNA